VKDRITQFLKNEGISPAEFADKIGVQRSSVSHVLNGRNYPSASFIQKMLSAYKNLNSRWLLLGEGTIFESKTIPSKDPQLFQIPIEQEGSKTVQTVAKPTENQLKEVSSQLFSSFDVKTQSLNESHRVSDLNQGGLSSDLNIYLNDNKAVERIVFFFSDKTFSVYTPSK